MVQSPNPPSQLTSKILNWDHLPQAVAILRNMSSEAGRSASSATRKSGISDPCLFCVNDAQIQAGQLQLEHVEFDVGALLESLVDVFTVQCTLKGVELGLDMPGTCLCLSGDFECA